MKNIVIYFLTGGIFTTLIVLLEQNGSRLWSGFATLMPVFTLVSYIFIGESRGGAAVSQHAKFVLVGTIISWVPYMLTVAWLSPHWGSSKAIGAGLVVFAVLAIAYLVLAAHFRWFQ